MRRRVVVLALAGLLLGCSSPSTPAAGPSSSPSPAPTVSASERVEIHTVPPFPGGARFDYQIGGPYEPDPAVEVVTRDRRERPAPGLYNVCYVNAFQTQPEEAGFWDAQHPDLLVRRGGRLVEDPGWPGERLLDTSTGAKRAALMDVVGPWIDGCAEAGYQAVEPDNLDSWTRSRGELTRGGNLAFARLLVARAHLAGLLVGQKNTPELGSAGLSDIGFSFAVAEECQVYEECDAYTDVYGDQVLEVEYTDTARAAFDEACRARGDRIAVVLRDRDVVPRGQPGYTDETC